MGDWRASAGPPRAVRDRSGTLIASLSGRVAAVSPDGAVVEVGGIGLAVQCTPGTIARLQGGEAARLATSLVVREDSLTPYGFADDDERSLFELLQTANGVGPRLAQAVLVIHPPREVRRAVSMADVKALMQVPGIGKKGAERLRSEEHTSELQSRQYLVCRLLLEKKKTPLKPDDLDLPHQSARAGAACDVREFRSPRPVTDRLITPVDCTAPASIVTASPEHRVAP